MTYPRERVGSISDLAALSPGRLRAWQQAEVSGYYAPGDKGPVQYIWSAESTATDNGGSVIAPTEGGNGRWLIGSSSASLRDFGAKSDNETDATAAIQSAFNSGLEIYGTPGDTYLVSRTGSKSVLSQSYYYSLLLPTGLIFDGRGATIKLADDENCTVVANANFQDGGAAQSGIAFRGVTIDCNADNQSAPPSGDVAGLLWQNVERSFLDVKVVDGYQFGVRVLDCDDLQIAQIAVLGSLGSGISLGRTDGDRLLRRSIIGALRAENCSGANDDGNGVIADLLNCQLGQIFQRNCAGGVKLQNGCEAVQVSAIHVIGGLYSTGNSGVKIQGTDGVASPKNILIDSICAKDQAGPGLYINYATNVAIGQYVGQSNGGSDVTIASSAGEVSIVSMHSSDAETYGALIQGGSAQIGIIKVDAPTGGRALQITGGAGHLIGSLNASGDDLVRALSVTDAATSGHISVVYSPTPGAVNYNDASGFSIGTAILAPAPE